MNDQVLNNDTEFVWCYLYDIIRNPFGVAGLMGCMYYGSKLDPKLDREWYTANVDSGQLPMEEFVHDKTPYGIMQYTFWGDKQSLYNMARKRHSSIGNLAVQMELVGEDLLGVTFYDTLVALQNCDSVIQAVDIAMKGFYGGRDRWECDRNEINLSSGYGLYYYHAYKNIGENRFKTLWDLKDRDHWVRVTKDRTAIRGAASILGRKVRNANKGDEYRYVTMSRNGNWRGIFCKDKICWISSKYSEIYARPKNADANDYLDR